MNVFTDTIVYVIQGCCLPVYRVGQRPSGPHPISILHVCYSVAVMAPPPPGDDGDDDF